MARAHSADTPTSAADAAKSGKTGPESGGAIHAARVHAVAAALAIS